MGWWSRGSGRLFGESLGLGWGSVPGWWKSCGWGVQVLWSWDGGLGCWDGVCRFQSTLRSWAMHLRSVINDISVLHLEFVSAVLCFESPIFIK